MRYYHYSTWYFENIMYEGIIVPSNPFQDEFKSLCMPLVFMTSNPWWEPSIQAEDPEGSWVKEPSDPDEYQKKGIPCYRFKVNLPADQVKITYPHPRWLAMLNDAKSLGSDVSAWHWTDKPCKFTEVCKRENEQWKLI